jgi:hypothetical protein
VTSRSSAKISQRGIISITGYGSPVVSYEWCGPSRGAELSVLHAAGFGQPARERDWQAQVREHSLGWVCARDGAGLGSFVNVAWDGGSHAFILDTVVAHRLLHQAPGRSWSPWPPSGPGRPAAPGCTWTSSPS